MVSASASSSNSGAGAVRGRAVGLGQLLDEVVQCGPGSLQPLEQFPLPFGTQQRNGTHVLEVDRQRVDRIRGHPAVAGGRTIESFVDSGDRTSHASPLPTRQTRRRTGVRPLSLGATVVPERKFRSFHPRPENAHHRVAHHAKRASSAPRMASIAMIGGCRLR